MLWMWIPWKWCMGITPMTTIPLSDVLSVGSKIGTPIPQISRNTTTAPTVVQRWMVMGMAEIKRGESLLIPFRNGKSIYDSQCKPRIYKTRKGFEKHFPGHYLGKDGVELVEYAEVVRCEDCKFWDDDFNWCDRKCVRMQEDDFCSYGERKDDVL